MRATSAGESLYRRLVSRRAVVNSP
jgi:hypothetical protein